MSTRRRLPGGFTLIEVLVALAIVAIGMAAVLSALSSSAGTVSYLRDKTFANWVALNKIATLRISGQQPAAGVTSGDTDYAGRSWHWRQEVVSTDVPGLVRMDVSVRPAEVKGGDDNGWVTTVSGIAGNSIGISDGATPTWGVQSLGLPTGAPGTNGTPAPAGAAAGSGTTGGTVGTNPATGTGTGIGTGIGVGTGTGTGTTTPGTPTPQSQQ